MREINTYDIEVMRRTMTAKEIAANYNITTNALYLWCRKHGTVIVRATDWEVQEALAIMTPKEVAYELNIGIKTVYYRAKKLGINIKNYKCRGE